jgi:hypothetical protein
MAGEAADAIHPDMVTLAERAFDLLESGEWGRAGDCR